jgi:hypothetical protein
MTYPNLSQHPFMIDEVDCGMDVGLLLGAAQLKARVVQAHIGHIKHDSYPFRRLVSFTTDFALSISVFLNPVYRPSGYHRHRAVAADDSYSSQPARRADFARSNPGVAANRFPFQDGIAFASRQRDNDVTAGRSRT